MLVRREKINRVGILSGEIPEKMKTLSNHFQLCTLATLLRTQMGYNSKTVKNYGAIEKQLVAEQKLPSAITETTEQGTELQTVVIDA